MAIYNETWTAADEMDYLFLASGSGAITRADTRKGIAATLSSQQANAAGRPVVKKTHAAGQVVIGAITHVGRKGCKVVKKGRFVLQAINAYAAADFEKKVISTTTAGKVDHHGSSDGTEKAQKGELAIVGGGNDTSTGGIGHYYLVECL